jgi:hypothetical protein
MIEQFAALSDGTPVQSYGGIVPSVVPDRAGRRADGVLGFADLETVYGFGVR